MALEGRGVSGDFGPLEGKIWLAEACLSPLESPGTRVGGNTLELTQREKGAISAVRFVRL